MDERIKQLIKQLIKQATVPGYMLGESYVQSRLDEQKFAELIVRECASLAYDGPGGILDHFGLEEHFGVEE